jgi:3-oxoacyl-[acyl-carrier-protein] synthase II
VAQSSENGRQRVVVTGVGMVTPLGNDPESTWESLVAGESGAGPITHFDAANYAVRFACELKDFDPTTWIDRKQARRMDRFSQMALSAARMAEQDSGISIAAEPDRVGAAVATGIGGLYAFENCFQSLLERGPDRTSPFAIVQIIPNMAAAWVSMELGARGPLAAECTACAASNMAIGDGLDAIRLGRADVMLCGGTEAPVTRVGIAGFAAMRALSPRNDDPKAGSRPFDADRDGFVMGEAAAMLVLEELEHARRRGAEIYAEVLGYGVSSDASHVTEPDPSGSNPARAMEMAFADAGIAPEDVGYVNAHGTSTPLGDPAETRVLKRALGEEKAYRTPVSSTKGATGHCLQRGILPPTINYETPDPTCDLDYIPNEARRQEVAIGVSNSFGFGGHNACVAFRRWDDLGGRR